MSDNNRFLGTQPIGGLLFKLAFPAILAQVVNMLYNLVDRMYIGHIEGVGTLALAGVGVCMPIIMLVSAFASLVSMGGAPRASIAMGKGDSKAAEKVLGNCFTLLLMIAAALTVFLFAFHGNLLLLFGASENTIGYAADYMLIYSLGTLFVQLALGMNAFITAQGFAKISMFTVLIGAVINIILDPIFIFTLDMGVSGAALATIISQAVSAAWVVWFLCGKKTILKIRKPNLRLQKKVILPCLALGLAPFIMMATESVIAVCFNSSLLKYGGDIAVGAMTILISVMQFSMLPLQGLAQGAQPITSYNLGAGNAERVRKAFFALLRASLVYSAVLWAVIMLAPQVFASMFTADAALIAYTKTPLRVYMAVSLLFSAQIACQMTFIAMGNAKASVFIAILRKIILLIPLIYILPNLMQNKAMAVYFAEPVADLISVVVTIVLFAKIFKTTLSQIDKTKKGQPLPCET